MSLKKMLVIKWSTINPRHKSEQLLLIYSVTKGIPSTYSSQQDRRIISINLPFCTTRIYTFWHLWLFNRWSLFKKKFIEAFFSSTLSRLIIVFFLFIIFLLTNCYIFTLFLNNSFFYFTIEIKFLVNDFYRLIFI